MAIKEITIEKSIYSSFSKEDWVMKYIELYGQYDGSHHKQWLIDQIARILLDTPIRLFEQGNEIMFRTGKPSTKYNEWVEKMMEYDSEYDDYLYDYDVGIPP